MTCGPQGRCVGEVNERSAAFLLLYRASATSTVTVRLHGLSVLTHCVRELGIPEDSVFSEVRDCRHEDEAKNRSFTSRFQPMTTSARLSDGYLPNTQAAASALARNIHFIGVAAGPAATQFT